MYLLKNDNLTVKSTFSIIIQNKVYQNLHFSSVNSTALARIVSILILTHNKIDIIRNNTFLGFSSIYALNVNGNGISKLEEDSLRGLGDSLEYLHLNDNNIKSLSRRLFTGLFKLIVLYLHRNEIIISTIIPELTIYKGS